MGWMNDIIDLLFPRYCRVCQNRLAKSEEQICVSCLQNLPLTHFHEVKDNDIEKLFWGLMPIERATAFFYYQKDSNYAKLLYHLKYYNHPEVGELLGRYAASVLHKQDFFKEIDLLIPVPLSNKKRRQRGYNQSEYIARGIQAITHIPISNNNLQRRIANDTQTHKNRSERWENVQGIFEIKNPDELRGKHILLIDDVLTTGATLRACGNQILATVPAKISVFTLAFSEKAI